MIRETPDPTAAVFVQPTPHGSWSSNNCFGAELQFAPQFDNRQRVLKLPEWGEPAVWTVSLGIDYSEAVWPAGGGRGFEVVAEVSYGAGGATETVEIDWIQGTTFSVPMNAISVDAFYNFPSSEAGEMPKDLVLRVLLGRGAAQAGIQPSKSAAQPDGTSVVVLADDTLIDPALRIPKFGKRLFVVPMTQGDYVALLNGNNFIRFFSAPDITGTAVSVGTTLIDQAALLQGVLVPPFAKYITLQNVGGLGAASVVLNFELEL